MSWRRFLRRGPGEEVVFAGDRTEAELVVNLLREEGFHPLLWADLPTPTYMGPVGMARVVVPPGEAEDCRRFLAGLRKREGEGGGGEGRGEEPSERGDVEGRPGEEVDKGGFSRKAGGRAAEGTAGSREETEGEEGEKHGR